MVKRAEARAPAAAPVTVGFVRSSICRILFRISQGIILGQMTKDGRQLLFGSYGGRVGKLFEFEVMNCLLFPFQKLCLGMFRVCSHQLHDSFTPNLMQPLCLARASLTFHVLAKLFKQRNRSIEFADMNK